MTRRGCHRSPAPGRASRAEVVPASDDRTGASPDTSWAPVLRGSTGRWRAGDRQTLTSVDERVVFADEQFAAGKVEELSLVFEQRGGRRLTFSVRRGSAELFLPGEPTHPQPGAA